MLLNVNRAVSRRLPASRRKWRGLVAFWFERNRQRRALSQLDDHSLADLGLSRRDFGDGFVAVLLPVYLGALGFSVAEIGLIATAALLGSALLTIAIGIAGVRRNLRHLLMLAAGLMVATGVGFAFADDLFFI